MKWRCPHCRDALIRTPIEDAVFWMCISCRGRLATVPDLNRRFSGEATEKLLSQALLALPSESRVCPVCDLPFSAIKVAGTEKPVELDVCSPCKLVWFDSDEFRHVERLERPFHPPVPAPQPRKVPALAGVGTKPAPSASRAPAISASSGTQSAKAIPAPSASPLEDEPDGDLAYVTSNDSWWHYFLTFLSLPVEHKQTFVERNPMMTWGIAASMVIFTLMALSDPMTIFELGLIPDQPFRLAGMTFVTSFFLHDGWLHLIFNLYYFWVYGDNVEDYLGHGKFLLLLGLASLSGDLLHAMFYPDGGIPMVGASCGISGVMLFYALRFRKAKIKIMLFFRIFRIPASWDILFWVAIQAISAVVQVSHVGSVSYLGHFGGAAAGTAFYYWDQRKR